MEALRADWRESLSRFEAEGAKAREAAAEEREAAARQRAAEREADAKAREEAANQRAAERAADAKERADYRLATEKLRTLIYASVVVIIGTILTGIAVATGILGLWLQQGG